LAIPDPARLPYPGNWLKKTGAVHLWADYERQKMFVHPDHSRAESDRLYAALNKRTAQLLKAGQSVIFDTNFNYYQDRQVLRQIADAAHATTIVIWVTTPLELAKQRAVHDQNLRNGYKVAMSNHDFDRIAGHLEPPRKDENALIIDGSDLDDTAFSQLFSSIEQRSGT
jgi:adenylylsulfate kinase-like enzyme